MIFGLSANEIALLVTAFGGGTTVQAVLGALRARREGARAREHSQSGTLVAETGRLRESEREAWARADELEARYDRMTSSRNKWRDYGKRVHLWNITHCQPPDDAYPVEPVE